jgi:hypothetical protein
VGSWTCPTKRVYGPPSLRDATSSTLDDQVLGICVMKPQAGLGRFQGLRSVDFGRVLAARRLRGAGLAYPLVRLR